MAQSKFPHFYGCYPEDALRLALCPEAETPKGNPNSVWSEGVEDIVERNCRYWKVWEEF